jgi:phosphoribosylanthranilate isomerase
MTKVKICGLSEPMSLQAALDAGADMVGLVFFDKSPRNVSMADAKQLADQARGRAKIVTLVVDPHDEQVMRIAEVVRPDFFQMHGSETPERVAQIKALSGLGVIKAIKVAGSEDVAKAKNYTTADLVLYDAKAPETLKDALPGGNGLAFDWSLLGPGSGAFLLAGGLNAENVADAIRVTGAPIVDVSSGVEPTPGVKDAVRIRKFIQQAKGTK